MSDIAIKIQNLSKKYYIGENIHHTLRHTLANIFQTSKKEEFWALKDIDFEIKKGEAIGIIGANGAGKSTLLKILSKITYPTTGRFEIDGRVSSLLEVGTGFHPELTGRENIFLNGSLLGMTRAEIKLKLDEIIDFSGVERFIDTPIKYYSSGMYVRLAFSVAAHLNTEILFVDEVLAVGDINFQKKCLKKMDNLSYSGKTILIVSHNMQILKGLVNNLILLEKGKVELIDTFSNTVPKYLNNNIGTHAEFNGLMKTANVHLNEGKLVLNVAFEFDKLMIPFIGFTVKDDDNRVVFSSNPMLDNLKMPKEMKGKGEISITVNHPILKGGRYFISLYLGDGVKDLDVKENCIAISIDRIDPIHGYMKPECEYNYLFE